MITTRIQADVSIAVQDISSGQIWGCVLFNLQMTCVLISMKLENAQNAKIHIFLPIGKNALKSTLCAKIRALKLETAKSVKMLFT